MSTSCTCERLVATGTRGLATLLLLAAPVVATGLDDEPDYGALADDFVRSHLSDAQLAGREPSAVTLEEFLELAYVHVDVGVFRIHYPKRGFVDMAGRKKKTKTYRGKPNADDAAHELSKVGLALLDLQLRWVELVGQAEPGKVIDPAAADAVLPGFEGMREWVGVGWEAKASQKAIKEALSDEKRAWKAKAKKEVVPQSSIDLFSLITAEGDAARTAAETFHKAMRSGSYWEGVTVHERDPMSIVLCPTRGDIVGFALYAARAREVPDDSWHPGIWQYTQFHLNGIQAISFRYAEEGAEKDLYGGKYMSDIDTEDGVVLQHAVQYAATMLLEYYYGPTYVSNDAQTSPELKRAQRVMGALFAGTRKFFVTYMYGKNEVRDEGDVANRTNARSQFIAGGNSNGGSLGKVGAETSRWRKRANKDRDFLVDLLDNVDFDEGKKGSGLVAKLELKTEGSKRGKGHVVSNPFLARDGSRVLPQETGPTREKPRDKEKRLKLRDGFRRDYVGFLRAYEIAFYRWLLSDYEPSAGLVAEKTALEAHATLFRELAEVVAEYQKPGAPAYDLSAQMNEAFERVYGVPLSWSPDAGVPVAETLERQFLQWIVSSGRH
ncbi:MAG: hypothetical protein GY711_10730 [bacterium]|nr:hypothetical protein [bacterium]